MAVLSLSTAEDQLKKSSNIESPDNGLWDEFFLSSHLDSNYEAFQDCKMFHWRTQFRF